MQQIQNIFEQLKQQFGGNQISFSDFKNILEILSQVDQRYIIQEDVVNELYTFLLQKQGNLVDLTGVEALLIQLNLDHQSNGSALQQTISKLLSDQSENNLINIKNFFMQLNFNNGLGYIENDCLIEEVQQYVIENKIEETSLIELCQYLVKQVNYMSLQYCQQVIMELESFLYQQYQNQINNNFHNEILVNIQDSNRKIELTKNLMLSELDSQARYPLVQDKLLTQYSQFLDNQCEISTFEEIQYITNIINENVLSSYELIKFIEKLIQQIGKNELQNSDFADTLIKLAEKMLQQIVQRFEERDTLIDQMKNENLLNTKQLELQNKYLQNQLSLADQNNHDQELKINQLSNQNDSQQDKIDRQQREITKLSEKLLLVANLETDNELLSRKSIFFEKQCGQLEQANHQLNQQNSLLSDQILSSQQLQDEINSSDNQSNDDKQINDNYSSIILSPIMLAVSKRRQFNQQHQIKQLQTLIEEQKQIIEDQKQTLKEQEAEAIFWKNKYEEENSIKSNNSNNNKYFVYSNLPSIAKFQQSINQITSQMDICDNKNQNIDQTNISQNNISPLISTQEKQNGQSRYNNIRKRNSSINQTCKNIQKLNSNTLMKVASLAELEIELEDDETDQNKENSKWQKQKVIDNRSSLDVTSSTKHFSEQDIADLCQRIPTFQPIKCKQFFINNNQLMKTIENLSQNYDYLNFKNDSRILNLLCNHQQQQYQEDTHNQCSDLQEFIVYSDSIYEINCQDQKIKRLLVITFSSIFILRVDTNLTIAKSFKLEKVSVLALSTKNANQVAIHFRQDQKDLMIETFRRIEMNLIIIKLFKIKKIIPTYQIAFTENLKIIGKQCKLPAHNQEEPICLDDALQIKTQVY